MSPNIHANFGNFLKKNFFSEKFSMLPLLFFAEIHVSIFFSKVRWPKILKFLHNTYVIIVYIL